MGTADLDVAMLTCQKAVDMTSKGHPQLAERLLTLGLLYYDL